MADHEQQKAFLGEGKALIDILDGEGQPSGRQVAGRCQELWLQPQVDLQRQISSLRDTAGQISAIDCQGRAPDLHLRLDRLDSELFALAFGGQRRAFSQGSGEMKDAEIQIVINRWLDCGKLHISQPMLRNASSNKVYTLDVDFSLRPRAGLLRVLAGSALATDIVKAGESILCEFSCSYDDVQGQQLLAMDCASQLCRVLVEGRDRISGRYFLFRAERAHLAPTAEAALIADDFFVCTLRGPVLNGSYQIVLL